MASAPEVHYNENAPEHYRQHVEKERAVNHDQPCDVDPDFGRETGQKVTPQKDSAWTRIGPFWLMFITAVVTAAVVGGAVGGGLGSLLNEERSKNLQRPSPGGDQSTSTATRIVASTPALQTNAEGLYTNYSIADPSNIATLALDCPNIDGTKYTSGSGSAFTISCYKGYASGDITAVRAYSLTDCIEACVGLNTFSDQSCTVVQYHAEMRSSNAVPYTNCWLKDGSEAVVSSTSDDESFYVAKDLAASAELVEGE